MSGRINSTYTRSDRGADAYWAPSEATTALLKIENVPRSVADPACGSGAILKVLQAHGADILEFVRESLDDGTLFAAFLLRLNFLESVRRDESKEKALVKFFDWRALQ